MGVGDGFVGWGCVLCVVLVGDVGVGLLVVFFVC